MRRVILFLGFAFGSMSHSSCQEATSPSHAVQGVGPSPSDRPQVTTYGAKSDLPACDDSSRDQFAYVKAENRVLICVSGAWQETGTANLPPPGGGSGGSHEGSGETLSLNCPDSPDRPSPPVGTGGQLMVSVPSDVDPCSVRGYMVGRQGDIKLQTAKDGSFYLNNVPSGSVDVVITAGSQAMSGGLALAEPKPDRGIRLNKLQATTGLSTRLGKISLPLLGSIKGKAFLRAQGVPDHAGIKVYIPGTSYDATTNTDGTYTIGNVPAGTHNLFFEKDGFARGQLESVDVDGEKVTEMADLDLYLETGVTGSFSVLNSFVAGSKTVVPSLNLNLLVSPSPGTVLMMIKEAAREGLWTPVRTNYELSYNVDRALASIPQYSGYSGPQVLTSPISVSISAKFANANGLESDPISKNIDLDLFSDGTSLFEQSFDLTLQTPSSMSLNLSNIRIPSQAEEMAVVHRKPRTWSNAALSYGPLGTSFQISLADTLENCGDHNVDVIFSAYNRKVKSPTYRSGGNGGSTSRKVTRSCHTVVTTAGAPSAEPAKTWETKRSYRAVWTGSKVFLMGWDDDHNMVVALYDPQTNAWTEGATTGRVPSERTEYRIEAMNGYVMVGGGSLGNTSHRDLFVYDIVGEQWFSAEARVDSQGGTIDQARQFVNSPDFDQLDFYNLSMFATGGKFYLLSIWQGVVENVGWTSRQMIHAYDPLTHTWSDVKYLPDSLGVRYNPVVVPLGGDEILLTGGTSYGSNTALTQTDIYNLSNDSVTSLSAMPINVTRDRAFYQVDAQRVLIGMSNTNRMHQYNRATNVWSTIQLGDMTPYETRGLTFWSNGIAFRKNGEIYLLHFDGRKTKSRFTEVVPWNDYSEEMVSVGIPGRGLFLFGISYYSYTNGSQSQVASNEGAIVRLEYADQFPPPTP